MRTNQSISLMGEMAIFVKVVDTKSFSEAARELGLSPSSVSRSITRLEKALATRLLERTTRKLRLSESGEEVYRRCKDMVSAAKSVMEVGQEYAQNPEGTVRVSVPKAVGRFVIHDHILEFLRAYPKVDVQLILNDALVDLIDDNVDLAFRITDRPNPGLMGKKLMTIDHMVCAAPSYLNAYGAPKHPRDLSNHNCIYLGEEPSDSRWKFKKNSKVFTVGVKGRYAANHTGVRLEAALHGLGIASLPYFTAQHALREGLIKQVLPEWDFINSYSGELWLLYMPSRFLPPKLRVFIDYMTKQLRQEHTLKNSGNLSVTQL